MLVWSNWNFDNDTARNVIIIDVDDSSSSQADNSKNNVLVVGEGPTFGINRSFRSPDKKFSVHFNKTNTKFCSTLHFNANKSYLFVNEKKSLSLKPKIKMITFQFHFVSEVYLMGLVLVSLNKYL